MPAKTDPINTLNPPGDSDPKQGDDHIRTLAKALIELLAVDHYVGVANPWGSDASGDETGEHAKVMFHEAISDPSVDAGKGALFIKGTPPELYFRDEDDGDVIQLTSGGIVNLTSAALLGILAKNTYFTAVNNAEDGTVNLIKAGTNDLATLPDSAEMASNAAPVEDEAIANKKYVDDQIVANAVASAALCKAWLRWTVSGITYTIEDSFNVDSLVRNSQGQLTVTFSTSFANANYAVAGVVEKERHLINDLVRNTSTYKFRIRFGTDISQDNDSDGSLMFMGTQ